MSRPEKTLDSWLQKARQATHKTNPNSPEVIASKILKLSKTDISLKSKEIRLSQKNLFKMNNLLGKLLSGKSLSSVLHHTEFHNISLKINGKVLSPRAETEAIVEYAIDNIPKNAKAIDIGTGSGAIGLALAKARPDLTVTLTDLTNKTLNLAKLNSRKNRITSVVFSKSDLIKNIDQQGLEGAFFLANLPYVNHNWESISHKNLRHEPKVSLFAGDDGLQIIKNFLDQLANKKLLTRNNWALLEHDPKQYKDLEAYSKSLGLKTQAVTDFITRVNLSSSHN